MRLAGPAKFTQRLFSVRPASSCVSFLRRPLDQHALHAADHGFADGARLFVELRLQARQALLLDLVRHVIRQRGRGRARALAVDEGERLVEIRLAHEFQCGLEVALRLARETRR